MKTTYLFRTFLLFFCAVCFISCIKEEDDSETICESDCTVIMGKVFSSNSQALSDIGIEIKYYEAKWLHHSLTRLKATAKTSNNGLFNMSFYLKDDELNKGYYQINVNMKNLDTDKYILPQDIAAYSDTTNQASWTTNLKRDTIYEMNVFVPQRSSVKIILKGFKPKQEGDRFEVRSIFPWGIEEEEGEKILDTKYGVCFSGYDKFVATKEENVFTQVPLAINETNIIQIFKVKNGVAMPEEHEVYISGNSQETLTFEY